MGIDNIPALEIFLGIMGFGLSILFCTTFCKACSRFREEQIEMEVARNRERDMQAASIFVIPLSRSLSQENSEDHFTFPRYSQEGQISPEFGISGNYGPPPSYHELECKLDDPPPAYTE